MGEDGGVDERGVAAPGPFAQDGGDGRLDAGVAGGLGEGGGGGHARDAAVEGGEGPDQFAEAVHPVPGAQDAGGDGGADPHLGAGVVAQAAQPAGDGAADVVVAVPHLAQDGGGEGVALEADDAGGDAGGAEVDLAVLDDGAGDDGPVVGVGAEQAAARRGARGRG
ncbi:hypothetical protein [Streptomyces somaliensis]|uniref:hypothetical protein n=1 Tax=Streptomyces somaliensis TaxID=78355 RepID=UPI0034E9560F|nr:hypothetical protein [Streptomyces somaliensis]